MKTKYSILHIDDDIITLEISKKILTQDYINLYTTDDEQEGLDIYHNKKPDIVILDINMPYMDGFEIAKRIKETKNFTKIVIMSGHDDTEKLLNAIDLKVDKYLIKPVKKQQLIDTINEQIEDIKVKYNPSHLLFLKYGFIWDKKSKILTKDNTNFKLTRKEIDFLSLLSENPNKTYSAYDILNSIWEEDFNKDFNTGKIRGLLDRLKKKLGHNIFQSIYGVGYKLKLNISNNNEKI
jgi:two-component system response regulator VanR